MKHAKLSASASSRWLNCPGSVSANEGLVDSGSSYANWGSCAHEVAEKCLIELRAAKNYLGDVFHGVVVDSEMIECVQTYVDYVKQFGGEHFYEQQVDFSPWVPEGFGTSDAIVIDGHTLRIIDLKSGQGVRVDAEENTQAQLYALGAINDYGAFLNIEKVFIAIVQPRLDHISEWELPLEKLLDFGEKAKISAKKALSPNAERVPGDKQCQWCKAKAICPALYNLTQTTLLQSFEVIDIDSLPKLNQLTESQLKLALDNRKLIESWLSSVEQYATEQILDGKNIGGYKLVEGRSVRQWIDEQHAEQVLSERFDESDLYKKTFVSVAQAEKLLGKKQADLLDELVTKPQGKPTLAPASDKRPPIGANISDFDACND